MTRDSSGAAPLRLELSPSGGLAATILAVHLSAAACVFAVLPGALGMVLAGLVLALGVASAWDRALLRGGRSPRSIEIPRSGKARLGFANGESAPAAPVRGLGVTRYWVALRIGSPMRHSMLVTAGMLRSEPFRLLRLWALWGRLPGVASGQLPA